MLNWNLENRHPPLSPFMRRAKSAQLRNCEPFRCHSYFAFSNTSLDIQITDHRSLRCLLSGQISSWHWVCQKRKKIWSYWMQDYLMLGNFFASWKPFSLEYVKSSLFPVLLNAQILKAMIISRLIFLSWKLICTLGSILYWLFIGLVKTLVPLTDLFAW